MRHLKWHVTNITVVIHSYIIITLLTHNALYLSFRTAIDYTSGLCSIVTSVSNMMKISQVGQLQDLKLEKRPETILVLWFMKSMRTIILNTQVQIQVKRIKSSTVIISLSVQSQLKKMTLIEHFLCKISLFQLIQMKLYKIQYGSNTWMMSMEL